MRGTALGALVRSSKNGDGRPSPSTHQPNICDARRTKNSERRRGGRVRRQRPDGGAFVDAADWRTEYLLSGTAVGAMNHERMNHGDNREVRAGGGVANRGSATIGIPAEDTLVGKAEASQGV